MIKHITTCRDYLNFMNCTRCSCLFFIEHREYFYEWCDIGSIYGAPPDCVWGGGRVGFGEENADEVYALLKEYGISARLTFSNSLLREEHMSDRKCNRLCSLFEDSQNGIIIYSDLLMEYIKKTILSSIMCHPQLK